MEVRRAQEADWRELRELRLRALAEAPDAFASTLEREAAFPDDVWRQRAQGRPASANFIVRQDGAAVGMRGSASGRPVGASRCPPNPAVAELLLRLPLDSPATMQE